jgi:hypothetical protein
MPVSFVQKCVLPTIRVQKALKKSQDGKLQGGMETAFLASIFDQSVMDFNKPVSTNLADNRALRSTSMVIYTKDDTTHHFVPMEEGTKGLINGVKSALQRLKKVAQLQDENTLFRMKDVEIEIHNKEIDEAIEQYGNHVTRDHNNMLLLREQNALVGRSVLGCPWSVPTFEVFVLFGGICAVGPVRSLGDAAVSPAALRRTCCLCQSFLG